LNRLEFALDIPQDGGLGVPIRESVAQARNVVREELRYPFIGNQIA